MGQLQLEDAAPESLQLDLGDRPGHMTCGGASGIDLRNPQVRFFVSMFSLSKNFPYFSLVFPGLYPTVFN